MKKLKFPILAFILLAVLCFPLIACSETNDNVAGIKIISQPAKTSYLENEMLDLTGMEVATVTESGKIVSVITDYTVAAADLPVKQGNFTYTVTYQTYSTKFFISVTSIGNTEPYSLANTPALSDSPLEGKTFYFLGSSVTFGSCSNIESMVDFIAKRNNCTCEKEAVSGTTLANNGSSSYVERITKLPTASPDVFICQLSTNDAKFPADRLGSVSNSKNIDDIDDTTTYGAIEYIIDYAKKTWGCPIVFYTNCYYENETYADMVQTLLQIAEKWDISVLNLYNDVEFNDISEEEHTLYMFDEIHPTRAGYRDWWVPVFEKRLAELVA